MANLLATYGLPRESRVAMLLLDTVDFPVAFWGAIKAGVVPVCLNTLLTTEQYAYILGDSRARRCSCRRRCCRSCSRCSGSCRF